MDVTQSGDMQQGSADMQWSPTNGTQWSSADTQWAPSDAQQGFTDAQWSPSNAQYGSGDMQYGSDSGQKQAKSYLALLFALLPTIGFLFDYLTHHEAEYMPAIIALVGSGIYAIYAATQKSKTFLAIYSLLFLASAIGAPALTAAYHYYFVSSDYATPMVGFLTTAISGAIALFFIAVAWIVKIVGELQKRSRDMADPQTYYPAPSGSLPQG